MTISKELSELMTILRYYKGRILQEIIALEQDPNRDHWFLHTIIESHDTHIERASEFLGHLYQEFNIKYYRDFREQ